MFCVASRLLSATSARAAAASAPALLTAVLLTTALLTSALALPAAADDTLDMTITIKDHKFEPATLKVPAGKAVKLTVNNLDDTAEEFDSHDLQVEKVIGAKQSAIVRLKPLDKGNYDFMGEYHEASAKGVVVAE